MSPTIKTQALRCAAVALAAAAFGPVHADTAYVGLSAISSSDPFVGRVAMDVWSQDLNSYVQGDNRINQIFRFEGDVARQKAFRDDVQNLALAGAGGQAGAESIAAKYQLSLTRTEYNAFIENVYLACEDSRTPYSLCNRFVAGLAPLERVAAIR
jgi:hypothetical protein